jgi:hypothetical protein
VQTYAKLATKAYGSGAVDRANAKGALLNAGYTDQAAELELDTIDLQGRMAATEAIVKAVRKALLMGAVNAQEAIQSLVVGGVTQDSATAYVTRWRLELTVPRIAARTAEILRWTKEGILSLDNAAVRLANLGWAQGDIDLHIAELEQAVKTAQQKAALRRARQLDQAQAAINRAQKAVLSGYCRIYSQGKLKRWYAERIISESVFRANAAKCGATPEQVDDLFKDAELARQHADAQAAKKGPSGISYTGQGADTSPTPG